MRAEFASLAAAVLLAGTAQAGTSLSCRVQQDLKGSGSAAPRTIEFVWSTADDGAKPTGPIKTRIGTIAPGTDLKSITLNGKPVQLPAQAGGLIRFGKAYDYGNRVVLAYRLERQWDATATPSEVVYALDKTHVVKDIDILPGSEFEAPGHCILVE